eukprot:COSAG01_NODE_1202_length_11263_cov_64.078466_2_plen_148_part_00
MAAVVLLDRAVFSSTLPVAALRVPKKQCGTCMAKMKPHLLNMPRMRSVVDDPSGAGDTKLMLLKQSVSSLSELPEDAQSFLRSAGAVEVVPHTVSLDYSYYSVDAVLRRLLPSGMEIPSSFETIGDSPTPLVLNAYAALAHAHIRPL